jgi:hypothetical protein
VPSRCPTVMRHAVLMLIMLAGCASPRESRRIANPPAPPPATAKPFGEMVDEAKTAGDLVDPNATSADSARVRVMRHLRDIGMRGDAQCVCEKTSAGLICSWGR